MARTGEAYLQGLRDKRDVWLGAERVQDVTTHPALAGACRKMAEYYDLHHAAASVCLVPNPQTAEPMSVSHLIPRSRADLAKRHACLERIAEWSLGMLGRTPDYINVSIAGFAGRADVWGSHGNDAGAANLMAYHQEVAQRDLALTHALVHPTVDKRVPEVDAGGGDIALHKVEDTEHGILVRGARLLATLAPFADEIVVYPGQPIPKEAHRYALAFALPMHTPGLKFVCRDSYAVPGHTADHPFSSRFDEQDAFVIFDNVEVPRHRVFISGDAEVYNRALTSGWVPNIMQQTTIRAMVKLEFAYELATRMVQAIGGENPSSAEQLGELWTYAELTRAALRAAETDAYEWGNGVWFCDDRPFRALRPTLPRWFARVNEIIKALGAHSLLTTPTTAQLAQPELAPLLNYYLQGANDLDAATRSRIFRTAWDFAGSALGSRVELYERFYLASSSRTYQLAHMTAQKDGMRGLLDRFLATES
jgi:4-hydroxyphenylacetate 3-monooxygenase oxygenase component